ncbi:hypothetical protein AKO1_015764 [Acrasis kona]|uniref:Uncharacterized protein n=1 Tax=Acrasis kona TaxID=1008807 RepID=A0AAW2ZIC9_9EUKA
MLRGEISSNIDDLDNLNQQFEWLPNSITIRPTFELYSQKNDALAEINERWHSIEDYILHKVFGKLITTYEDKFKALENDLTCEVQVFERNEFPYQIPVGNHWVLWYGSKTQPYSSAQISKHIESQLTKILGEDTIFDFAWYILILKCRFLIFSMYRCFG